MTAFTLGVVSSLVATALTVGLGWLGSARVRRVPVALLSRLTGTGIVRSYASQRAANAHLAEDLAKARWIKVLTGRGNELTRDSFAALWRDSMPLESVQVLLPDPDEGEWLARREEEMSRLDPGFHQGLLSEQVRTNVQYMSAVAARRDQVSLRLYDLPHLGRVIVTDRVAYLTTYTRHEHGRNSPCFVYGNPSPMYEFALRIFTTAWESAREPTQREVSRPGEE